MDQVQKYGIVKPKDGDENDSTKNSIIEIEDVIEKPSSYTAPSNLAFAARYIMTPNIMDALERVAPGKGGEIQLTDGIRLLLKEGIKGYSVCLADTEKRYDIGNMFSYYEAFIDFALEDDRYGYQLKQYLFKKLNL